jgi:hypothetical protein
MEPTAQIKELLEAKHNYAGIISAWESAENSIEISNQGKSIMLFSVLSIIFVGSKLSPFDQITFVLRLG